MMRIGVSTAAPAASLRVASDGGWEKIVKTERILRHPFSSQPATDAALRMIDKNQDWDCRRPRDVGMARQPMEFR